MPNKPNWQDAGEGATSPKHPNIVSVNVDDFVEGKERNDPKWSLAQPLLRQASSVDEPAEEVPKDRVARMLDLIKRWRSGEGEEEDEEQPKPWKPILSWCFLLLVNLPLAVYLIYLGYTNLANCPLARLPEWLLVVGVLLMTRVVCMIGPIISSVILLFINPKIEDDLHVSVFAYIDKVGKAVAFFWGFYGIFLICVHWNDHTTVDTASRHYCAHSVMLVSKILVAIVVLTWTLVTVVFGCFICALSLS